MEPLFNYLIRRWVRQLIIVFLLFPLSLSAQFSGLQFVKKKKVIHLPFESHSNLIILPIQINKSDTLNFILDTGISMTLITDPTVAASVGLHYVRTVKIVGVGEGQALEALVAINNSINLPGLEAKGQSVVTLSEDVLHLSNYVGMPIHGIFGFDLFKNFVVKIDFHKKILTLYPPERFRYKGKGEKIPITVEDAKPYLEAKAVWADNREVPIRVILDTGAGHALSLDMGTHQEIRLPDKIVRAQLGRGLNGTISGSLGRLAKIRIGKYELEDVITSFPDTNSMAAQITKRVNRQGNIGCELLRRFDVIFNYSGNYIVLKPNKKAYKASFERDMSGLDLRANGENFRSFVIDRVEAGSPAEQAGLMAGDQIITINGTMAHQMKLSEIYKLFQRKEGKQIKMVVRRGNDFIFTEFELKRII